MTQQHRLMQLSLVGATLLGLFAVVYLVAWKRFARRAPVINKHTVETDPEDALKYWTEDKMRNTQATNMPHVTTVERGKQRRSPNEPHKS